MDKLVIVGMSILEGKEKKKWCFFAPVELCKGLNYFSIRLESINDICNYLNYVDLFYYYST